MINHPSLPGLRELPGHRRFNAKAGKSQANKGKAVTLEPLQGLEQSCDTI